MRRLGQALVLLVMAICAAGATGFVVLAVQYHRFSADIKRSEAPLPATIRAALPPSKGTIDHPQVTLVRGSGGLASGGLVLFRTVPDNGTAAFLSVPPSTILDDVRVSRQSIPRLVHALQARLGIQVAHVAVINLGNVSRLVDGIGGIELRNPTEVQLPVSPSRTWRFPAGTLRLNGPHTAVYLRQGAPGSDASCARSSATRSSRRASETSRRPAPRSRIRP
jgi:anionic cell wall polymer biosynthesis LytR-Cps2A-Psr (LCP) family protein